MTTKKEAAEAAQAAAEEQTITEGPVEGQVPEGDDSLSGGDPVIEEAAEEVVEAVLPAGEEGLPEHGSYDAASRGLHTDASGSYTPPTHQSYEG